jgi:hypothetical protein
MNNPIKKENKRFSLKLFLKIKFSSSFLGLTNLLHKVKNKGMLKERINVTNIEKINFVVIESGEVWVTKNITERRFTKIRIKIV